MIGFFEHQFLSYKKKSLANLVALAWSDGKLDAEEEKVLYKVGAKYGLKDHQITKVINSSKPFELFIPKDHTSRMNHLFDLVQLIYADSVIDEKELEFCKIAVKKFGYHESMISWLLKIFREPVEPDAEEWKEICRKAQEDFAVKG